MADVALNSEKKRFELEIEGFMAFIDYNNIEPNILDFLHTEVPESLSGKGVGSKLVEGALQYCKDNDLKIIPTCGFVKKFIEKHPEWSGLLVK